MWGITRPRPRGVRIRHRPFLRCLEETLPDTSRKTASDRLRKFSNRGGLKRGLCGITPTCYKVQRYSKCAIFSGFPQETKPVGEVTQAGGLIPAGLSANTSESVNYGVSCVSEEDWSPKKGLAGAEWSILEIFSSLDVEGRRRVFAILAKSMREEVPASSSDECSDRS